MTLPGVPMTTTVGPIVPATVPFEGVEKRLFVQLKSGAESDSVDLRAWTPAQWQVILDCAFCEIKSVKRLGDAVIYLLSESTLVAWPTAFLLKTCGRTTPFLAFAELLRVLEGKPSSPNAQFPKAPNCQSLVPSSEQPATMTSLELAGIAGLGDFPLLATSAAKRVASFFFSRLEFLHPECQVWPHRSFSEEVGFVNLIFPPCQDSPDDKAAHCYATADGLYVCFYESPATRGLVPFRSAEFLMQGIPEDSVELIAGEDPAKRFDTSASSYPTGASRPVEDWISNTSTAHELDEFWFEPCGYSCNALVMHPSLTTTSPNSHNPLHSTPLLQAPIDHPKEKEGSPIGSSPLSDSSNFDSAINKYPLFFDTHISPEPVTSYASLEIGLLGWSQFPTAAQLNMHQLITPLQPHRLHATFVSTAGDAEIADVTYMLTKLNDSSLGTSFRLRKRSVIHFSSTAAIVHCIYETMPEASSTVTSALAFSFSEYHERGVPIPLKAGVLAETDRGSDAPTDETQSLTNCCSWSTSEPDDRCDAGILE